jgi:hypothetical protein
MRTLTTVLMLGASLGAAACNCGGDGDPELNQDPIACDLGIPQAGEARIRRLTPTQYRNTVRALFGDPTIEVELNDEDDDYASALAVEQFDLAAADLAPRALDLLADYDACADAGAACAEAFVDGFGARAFRRPLTDDERGWLTDAFATARGGFSFEESIMMVTQSILTYPAFLYLAPIGEVVEDSPHGLRALDDYELAERLAYFLWSTMPDDELFEAAAAGALTEGDGAGLRAQAERMMDDPRAHAMAHDFVGEWFQLDGGTLHFGLDEAPKDPELYPEVDDDLRAAMRTELGALMEKEVFDGGEIGDLFTDTAAYVNGPLAEIYGVAGGPTGADEWAWVELDPTQRAGLLTRAAFASTYATARVQAPIRRGTFVLRNVLCYDQPPPPPDVDNRPIEDNGEAGPSTVREATEARTQGSTCTGCHSIIDPIGFSFEHYDAIGRFRDEEIESQLPIDASGALAMSGNVDGPVADAIELSQKLAQSEAAGGCLTKRWFTFALGREPALLDQCSFEAMEQATGGSRRIRDLLMALIESDAFKHVNPGLE